MISGASAQKCASIRTFSTESLNSPILEEIKPVTGVITFPPGMFFLNPVPEKSKTSDGKFPRLPHILILP